MRWLPFLTAAAFGVLSLGPAIAQPLPGDLVQCNTRLVRYKLAENASLATEQSLGQAGCSYAFPGDAYTIYQSITVVSRPRHLTITPNSNGFGFAIRVRGGYRGPDTYTMKACGLGREGPGCVTLTFNVTVY